MLPTSTMQLDKRNSSSEGGRCSSNLGENLKELSSSSSPSPSPSSSATSASPSINTKKRTSETAQRTVQHSLSLNSLPTASSTARLFLGSSEQLPNATVTARVIEALTKFQTCLFLLSNTVVRLHESLKLIIPIGSEPDTGVSREPTSSTATQPATTMVKTSLCPRLGKKLKQSLIGSNDTRTGQSDNEKNIQDTVLNLPSEPNEGSCEKIEKSVDEKKTVLRKCSSVIRNYVGIILSLLTSFCMSIIALVVKYMDDYHPVSKVIWRLQGVLLPSLIIFLYVKYYQKKPLIVWRKDGADGLKRPLHWKWQLLLLLVIRGVVGCSADIFQYYSLKSLPLADSTVISFSTPIFVCIVAHFILKEKCGVVPIFTALLTLCGVIVICKPPILTGAETMSNTVLLGNILAALCMICNTFATVIMRYLQHVHFAVTMLALGIVGTVEGFIATLFTGPMELPTKNHETDWLLAVLIAGLFFFGQLTMTLALQHEEAGVVSLVRTCDVLFAFIWQVNFLHQGANVFSYIGAVIVTLGVIITAIRRWVGDLPEHCPIRKRLCFLLR